MGVSSSLRVPKAEKYSPTMWRIQLRFGSNRTSVTVTAPTEKECIRKAQYVKAEYLAGKREAKKEPQKLPTLREACTAYINSKVLSPSTERGYLYARDHHFSELMDRSLSDIKPAEYQAAVMHEARVCSAKTLKNSWGFVASVLRQQNISVPNISLPQVVPKPRAFLDPEQIKTFISAAEGNQYEIPMLLALSSLRRSEILALRWEHIDLPHKKIFVTGAAVYDKHEKLVQKIENKNRSSTRFVPILIPQLYDALKRSQQSSGLVVVCNPDAIRRNINKICIENNLPPVGTHGLRHSFASLAYHLRVPEKITMEIGGWNDDGTMKRIYTHISQSDVQRYEEHFASFFSSEHKNSS